MNKETPLKKENWLKRDKFGKHHINQNINFKYAEFSEEKRFSYDGSEYMKSLFYNVNKTIIKPFRTKRQMGGGGEMIIEPVSSLENLEIKIIEGSCISNAYSNDLKKVLIPWSKSKVPGGNWILQLDNFRIHTIELVLEIFDDSSLCLLQWPSYSLDLNIIENVWSLMNSLIYNNKQYKSRNDLVDAILDAASKTDKETI